MYLLLNLHNPLNTDTLLIWTLSMVPSVSVFKRGSTVYENVCPMCMNLFSRRRVEEEELPAIWTSVEPFLALETLFVGRQIYVPCIEQLTLLTTKTVRLKLLPEEKTKTIVNRHPAIYIILLSMYQIINNIFQNHTCTVPCLTFISLIFVTPVKSCYIATCTISIKLS